MLVKFFCYFPFCGTESGVLCLLPYYIAALHLFNIGKIRCLSNLSKHFHRYSNLLLSISFIYFGGFFFNFCMISFACVLVYLWVCAVFVLCTV